MDEILGVGVHERIEQEVYAGLAEVASDLSYMKTGKNVSEVSIIGQTVMKSERSIEKVKISEENC